jgi:ADP-heptose:LPS heptosyltransferase
VQIVVTMDGIGDHVLGLTTAEGLRHDHPGTDVVYVCKPWCPDWARLFWPAHLVTTEEQEDLRTYRPHDTYAVQNAERLARPRWEHYAGACGTIARLPQPQPLSTEALAWAERYRGCVLLAPWATTPGRTWLLSHWLRLERLLRQQGLSCLVLDGRTNDHDRNAAFESEVALNEDPVRVAALLSVAACTVTNDSGLAHVSGMFRRPAVVVCAQICGEQMFGIYGTVKTLQGPLLCSGCHWLGPHWRPACDSLCASLQAIAPETVLAAVRDTIRPT